MLRVLPHRSVLSQVIRSIGREIHCGSQLKMTSEKLAVRFSGAQIASISFVIFLATRKLFEVLLPTTQASHESYRTRKELVVS